jgi:hypothetical protein
MIVYDVTHQRLAVILAVAAVIAFCSAHGLVLSSTWMPYYYFAPFFLFVVAAASVAAGNNRHLWCMALAGGLLVHGHVEFLFFVPVIAIAAIVSLVVLGRVRFAECRRDWLVFGAVIGVFYLGSLIPATISRQAPVAALLFNRRVYLNGNPSCARCGRCGGF